MIRGFSPGMYEDERAPIWDIADADGRVLAAKISYVALRARIDAGLLPAAALVAKSGEREWRPLTDILSPSRTQRITSLWYVTRSNARSIVGPVDTDRILRGLASQRVPVDSVVCRTGDDRWTPIAQVPEFMRAVCEARFDGELTLVVDTDTDVRAAPPPPFARAG
jgi:hypothetical protein